MLFFQIKIAPLIKVKPTDKIIKINVTFVEHITNIIYPDEKEVLSQIVIVRMQ
ncbi:MAG: hypothetical protein GX190_00460 [Mollicutes bacterium]|nr:hypothetical protein [Mollicutes bacterium]